MKRVLKNIFIFSIYISGFIITCIVYKKSQFFYISALSFFILVFLRCQFLTALKPMGFFSGRNRVKKSYEKRGDLAGYKKRVEKAEQVFRIIASASIFLGIIHYVILLYA